MLWPAGAGVVKLWLRIAVTHLAGEPVALGASHSTGSSVAEWSNSGRWPDGDSARDGVFCSPAPGAGLLLEPEHCPAR